MNVFEKLGDYKRKRPDLLEYIYEIPSVVPSIKHCKLWEKIKKKKEKEIEKITVGAYLFFLGLE